MGSPQTLGAVVDLPLSQNEVQRIAMTVPDHVDLRCEAISASIRRTSNIVCHRPALLQRLKREKTLFQDPNSPGNPLQGAPVRCFQRMASIMFRWFFEGRPVFPRSGGSKGANLSHM